MNLLLGRPVTRLLAKELLAGAAESGGARAVFGTADEVIDGVGVARGADQDAGVLASHDLGISAHQTGRRPHRGVMAIPHPAAVASGPATLATKRTLLLTWAGLPPADRPRFAWRLPLTRSPRRRAEMNVRVG